MKRNKLALRRMWERAKERKSERKENKNESVGKVTETIYTIHITVRKSNIFTFKNEIKESSWRYIYRENTATSTRIYCTQISITLSTVHLLVPNACPVCNGYLIAVLLICVPMRAVVSLLPSPSAHDKFIIAIKCCFIFTWDTSFNCHFQSMAQWNRMMDNKTCRCRWSLFEFFELIQPLIRFFGKWAHSYRKNAFIFQIINFQAILVAVDF